MQLRPVINTGEIVANSALDSMTPAPSRARRIAFGRCDRCVARMLCGSCICSSPIPVPDPYSMRTSGLVEVGAFRINNLRRSPKVELYAWNPISAIPKPKSEQKKPRPDGMARARYYQSLLDSGEVETRAELARHLGVSRARVTQVLKRLDNGDDERQKFRTA